MQEWICRLLVFILVAYIICTIGIGISTDSAYSTYEGITQATIVSHKKDHVYTKGGGYDTYTYTYEYKARGGKYTKVSTAIREEIADGSIVTVKFDADSPMNAILEAERDDAVFNAWGVVLAVIVIGGIFLYCTYKN